MARRPPRRSASSPVDHDARWRPRSSAGPVCGCAFDGKVCSKRGAHYCEPRADRVVQFFAELLVHTKGRWARTAFVLEDWQEHEIIRPIFGEVVWSTEVGAYVRRYRVAGIVLGRKNGKSEIVAGIALYLLVGDDEESAEVYGAAADTKQARKVWEPADRMRQLSPVLSKRLGVNKNERRIFDERTGSYYEIITADALGELGHNPHGFILDEVLSQPNGSLWDAMRTAAGTRAQPLFLLITTETNRPHSFGAEMIDELEKVQESPSRAPHIFAYVRKTPREANPWDEKTWPLANPALGSFLSVEAFRQEALEAKNDPTKENSFRQYRLNQRVQQETRWMQLHLYDLCGGLTPDEVSLAGRQAWGGLDLSATSDLTALAWFLPATDEGRHLMLWRFWVPEDRVGYLDNHTGGLFGLWVREGFVVATEGDVVDYDLMHEQIARDARLLRVRNLGLDQWNSAATSNWLEKKRIERTLVAQTYAGMTMGMKELMRLTRSQGWNHGGHPVARWCFDAVEVRRDLNDNIRPIKPDRDKSGVRIDAVPAAVMAIDGWLRSIPRAAPAAARPEPQAAAGGSPFRGHGRLKI